MRDFSVVASGDFLLPDGSPAFPEFDFTPLQKHPRVSLHFLRPTQTIAPDQIAGADALILSSGQMRAESFADSSRLALVSQFGAGFDHIDVAAATTHGVAVTNTPHGVRRPVAVSILTLMYALTTNLLAKTRLVRQGARGWAEVASHNGVGLTGKTLGSLGVGNIGAELFRLAKPLEMKFIAHDPFARPETASELGVELVGLDELFRRSDVLSINCPLSPQTRHLVNAEQLALMKPTAYLINTARGGVVDQRALTDTLANRRIAGAGLDVFEKEPIDPDDPLLNLDNVVLTPHALCWSDELYAGCGRDAVAAVMGLLDGQVPAHLINRDVAENPAWRAKLARLSNGSTGSAV